MKWTDVEIDVELIDSLLPCYPRQILAQMLEYVQEALDVEKLTLAVIPELMKEERWVLKRGPDSHWRTYFESAGFHQADVEWLLERFIAFRMPWRLDDAWDAINARCDKSVLRMGSQRYIAELYNWIENQPMEEDE